ncbi:MAG: TonB-dependent receptor [Flavobacterium sp.]|nr:TonB-dependent receptor [Flavobacterium sp.]
MKKVITILIIGFFAVANAQISVSGTVSDKNNQPLKGVSVSILETNKNTITNDLGQYSIDNLPNNNFKISFLLPEYSPSIKNISTLNSNNILNITLDNVIFKMDQIIVSTAFNKLQSQNVMKIEHSSIKDLQQKGGTTLIEGLTTIPGVSQISTGVSIGKPVIRGLSSSRVLVYSQGVRLENQQFGEEHGLGLNDSGIESVEVIKGPASLLYGSDAIGGVLYFNPEKFADTNTFRGDFNQRYFSNTLGTSTNLGIKTSTDKWKFLARGSYSEQSDYLIPDKNRVTNTRYNEQDFKTGIGYVTDTFSSIFRYNLNKLDIGIPENGIAQQTTKKTTDFPKQGVSNNLLSWNNFINFEKSKLDFNLGYIANDRKEFAENDIPNLHWKLKTINYDVKYHLPKYRKLESILGIQGMYQTNTNYGQEFLIPNALTKDFGIFGTCFYQWKKNIFQAGLRFDNRKVATEANGISGNEGSLDAVEKQFNSWNASLGLKTNLQEKLTLRLNVASGYRAPNLSELTSNGIHEGSNRYEIGNSNLKNEQNLQTDLNLEYQNSHFEFFLNGFYNHIDNYIFISPNGKQIYNKEVYDYVQNKAYLFGGEVGLHFHPHPLDWLHFDSSFESVTGKKSSGYFLPLIPANVFKNTIKTDFKIKKWLSDGYANITVSHTLNQNNFSEFETKSNDYTIVNLGLGGKIKLSKLLFNVNINANNLFDKTYISHLSRLKNDGIQNIGRNVVFGFNFNI